MPAFIDPTAAQREGMAALSGAVNDVSTMRRQKTADALTQRAADQQFGLGQYQLEAAKRSDEYEAGMPAFEKELTSRKDLTDKELFAARADRARSYGQLQSMVAEGKALDMSNQIDDRNAKLLDLMRSEYQMNGKQGLIEMARNYGMDEAETLEKLKGYKIFPDYEQISDGQGGYFHTFKVDGQRKMFHVKAEKPAADPQKDGYFNEIGDLVLPSGLTVPKSTLEYEGENYYLTGKMPPMGMKSGPIRQAIVFYGAEAAKRIGADSGGTLTARNQAKALSKSLDKQEQNIGATGSFVKNMEKQRKELNEIAGELSRLDDRILNVPINLWADKVKGDPKWKKYVTLVTDLSMEAGKLASGNASSIAELSVSSQERWNNIHDLNMSINALGELMDQTVRVGNMRYNSMKEQAEETRTRMREVGKVGKAPIDVDKAMSRGEELEKQGLTDDQIKAKLREEGLL